MSKAEEKHRAKVRARIVAQLDRLDNVHDLEFIEMVAAIPEQPFSDEVAVEVLLELTAYVARAKVLYERELERLHAAQPDAEKPT